MADLFPTDPKHIRERIRRYERALKRELEERYGGGGYGKRFLLGPLYMLMGDVNGALASFDWYEGAYPDDGGDPYQYLTWSLALFRCSAVVAGKRRLTSSTKPCLRTYISYPSYWDEVPSDLTYGTVATSHGLSTPLRCLKSC